MVLVVRERYKRRNKLKQVREEAGFTQTKAAELMGINRTALAKIEEVVKVYHFGAKKYTPNSWQNLPDAENRYYSALLRHLVAYRKGETKDEESGLHPLAHVIWNGLALLYFAIKKK